MGVILAVDIGGTHIRAATYPRNSIEPIRHQRIATKSDKGTTLERLMDLIAAMWQDSIEAITVATAGPLDPETGIILSAANIPGWVNLPLRSRLSDRFKVPVFLGNDANLAALGEWQHGAGRGYHDLIYLTISTGIGGGVISNDVLLLGQRGLAAELGHVTVLPDGPLCPCGQRGHLEALASGPAIENYIKEMLAKGEHSALESKANLTTLDIAQAARQGDPLAQSAFERAGHFLGTALADLLHIFNPAIVIFGGGVAQSGELLFKPMKGALKQHVLHPGYIKDLKLVSALLGDNAGLIGALVLAEIKLPHLPS